MVSNIDLLRGGDSPAAPRQLSGPWGRSRFIRSASQVKLLVGFVGSDRVLILSRHGVQGKPTERENSSAVTAEVNARGTVPRASGTHVACGEPGPTGSPVISLARTNVTSGGGVKSRAGSPAVASFM